MIDMYCIQPGGKPSPAAVKRLRKLVLDQVERTGESGHSASGYSALVAIGWCEANADGWVLSHIRGAGYTVKAVRL